MPTLREFEASTYRDVADQYVVNGDETLENKHDLRDYYDQMVGSQDGESHDDGLVINRVYGVDDKWTAPGPEPDLLRQHQLRLAADQRRRRDGQGTALWEAASLEGELHLRALGGLELPHQQQLRAVLRRADEHHAVHRPRVLPEQPRRQRNILVNASSLMNSGSWTPGNILGHELGHTLGFRHEHTRPEAGTCFEDNNWRALTPYDSASIMHYPQCNGSSNLTFTGPDGKGVRALYGS